ncbi:MAG: hypothetical protein JWO31_207 [Phycisphaerales bacterium]|nr:hypothetical protein [Phycisphaerales bacterium]
MVAKTCRLLFATVAVSLSLAVMWPAWGTTARADLPAPPGSPPATTQAALGAPTPAAIVRIDGEIDDYNRDQLKLRFGRAKAAGAKVIVLEIDTYGGLVTSGLDISRFLKNQRDVRTIALVDSKAISAGAMIALACDEIVMTPSGTLGDCAPIRVAPGGGFDPMGATERSKAESPVLADFRESAERHGYPPLLAEAMVSLPYTAHWVEDGDGHRKFVDTAEYKTLTAASGGWHPVPGEPDPIDGPDTLLTVHSEQAVRYGLATGTAAGADDLAAQRNLSVIAHYQSGAGDRVVALLGSSPVRLLLMVVFVNALLIAVKTPGTGSPEAIALLTLALLVGVPMLTGYASWVEVLMIVGGIGLILFEVFVFPGHLVSALLGGLLLLAGIALTFVGDVRGLPGGWSLPQTGASLQRGIQLTVVGLAASMLVFGWVRRYLPNIPYFNRLILAPTGVTPTGDAPAIAASPAPPLFVPAVPTPAFGPADAEDVWPFVGTVGVAVSDLKPGGTVRFPYADDSRVASAVSRSGYVSAGSKVVVREVHGSTVAVQAAG